MVLIFHTIVYNGLKSC